MNSQLAARLAEPDCPHMAVFIQSTDDLPPVLAAFYALGAARNGWLVQGSLPGEVEEDRRRLLEAGLDVASLEDSEQLSIVELDLSLAPEEWVEGWSETLDARLREGFEAVWFARFPIPPADPEVEAVIPFEDAWMERFRERPMVTLCPYVVPEMSGNFYAHGDAVAAVHDEVVDLRGA